MLEASKLKELIKEHDRAASFVAGAMKFDEQTKVSTPWAFLDKKTLVKAQARPDLKRSVRSVESIPAFLDELHSEDQLDTQRTPTQ